MDDGPNTCVPATHMGDLDGFLTPGFGLDHALVSEPTDGSSLSASPLVSGAVSLKETNKPLKK